MSWAAVQQPPRYFKQERTLLLTAHHPLESQQRAHFYSGTSVRRSRIAFTASSHCLLASKAASHFLQSNPSRFALPNKQSRPTQLRCDIVPSRPPSTSLRQEISTFQSTTLPSTTALRDLLHHRICSLDLIVARSLHRHIPQSTLLFDAPS